MQPAHSTTQNHLLAACPAAEYERQVSLAVQSDPDVQETYDALREAGRRLATAAVSLGAFLLLRVGPLGQQAHRAAPPGARAGAGREPAGADRPARW